MKKAKQPLGRALKKRFPGVTRFEELALTQTTTSAEAATPVGPEIVEEPEALAPVVKDQAKLPTRIEGRLSVSGEQTPAPVLVEAETPEQEDPAAEDNTETLEYNLFTLE